MNLEREHVGKTIRAITVVIVTSAILFFASSKSLSVFQLLETLRPLLIFALFCSLGILTLIILVHILTPIITRIVLREIDKWKANR